MPKETLEGKRMTRGYKICPSLKQDESSPSVESVDRFLRRCGYELKQHLEDIELIVLRPRLNEQRLRLEDLKLFHEALPGGPNRVLLFDPLPSERREAVQWLANREFPWLRICRSYSSGRRDGLKEVSELDEVRAWLEEEWVLPQTSEVDPPDQNDLRGLLLWALYGSDASAAKKHWDPIARASHPWAKTTIELLQKGDCADFLYAVLRLATKYSIYEHDLNRARHYTFRNRHAANSKLIRMKALLDASTDLLNAMRWYSRFARRAANETRAILLIDDNPEPIRKDLERIIKLLVPGHSLAIWRPAHRDGHLSLNDLVGYRSLITFETILEKKIDIKGWPGDSSPTLKNVLDEVPFILVDNLFADATSKEHDLGERLIRGLVRVARDRSQQPENQLPRVIVLSRADDIRRIRETAHSGAVGYVLKNRLLALPAVLGEVQTPISENRDALHRNFRKLYNLPNETLAYLHRVFIPPLPFHKERAETNEIDGAHAAIAKLLLTLPKTDLHIHVGSCMSPEFLVVASLVMLARHPVDSKMQAQLLRSVKPLFGFWKGSEYVLELDFAPKAGEAEKREESGLDFRFAGTPEESFDPVEAFAARLRKRLVGALRGWKCKSPSELKAHPKYHSCRSILHRSLGIRDHWPVSRVITALETTDPLAIVLFALCNGRLRRKEDEFYHLNIHQDDVLRLFLIFLAFEYPDPKNIEIITNTDGGKRELLSLFEGDRVPRLRPILDELHRQLWKELNPSRAENWSLTRRVPKFHVDLGIPTNNVLRQCPVFKDSPIEFLLATGTRSTDLASYLAGCCYTGAEHLRHPLLLHLFAQQTLAYFVQHGVFYAELRAAASGYANDEIEFSYQDVCKCLEVAFGDAQTRVHSEYKHARRKTIDTRGTANGKPVWLWTDSRANEGCGDLYSNEGLSAFRFPVRVNLVFTGKRHKAASQLIREAAAIVVLRTSPRPGTMTARQFASREMKRCRMTGFDLAGLEEASLPEHFRDQFTAISRLHVPITAHAGENASSNFVESAILDLRARRLGHGLAMAEDKKLMSRAREDRICIELCPVSNFQTNKFGEPGTADRCRAYPLLEFLHNGNALCINTDNPIISFTNIIKEYFQASYAYGKPGLSLWEVLRIIRMGFVHSFMSLPERRAILELADQIFFDLFSREDIVSLLRDLVGGDGN